MSGNVFLRDLSHYQQQLNPLKDYVEQTAFYVSKMSGKPLDLVTEHIKNMIRKREGAFAEMQDPVVEFYERGDNLDRYETKSRLSSFITTARNERYVVAPTMTCYLPVDKMRSPISSYMKKNKILRAKHKKIAQAAKAAGRMDEYEAADNYQDNRKRTNNSCSGIFGSNGTVLGNSTGHSTLTSITRTLSSLANASNEKVISGNRHYRSPEIAKNNIIFLASKANKHHIRECVEQYGLKFPTVEETMACIKKSTDFYWRDRNRLAEILRFVKTLDEEERAAVVYTSDLYHIRKFNEVFMRQFIGRMSAKPTQAPQEGDAQYVWKADEMVVNYAHQICMDELRGFGKEYPDMKPEDLATLRATTDNILGFIEEYRLFIDTFFLSNDMPVSSAYIQDQIRETVVLSDTDSTMFAIDEWVVWWYGHHTMTTESFAISGAVMFMATQSIAHLIAQFSANMNVEREKIFLMAMKPEYVFDVFFQTSVAKHYFTRPIVKEGSVYKKPEVEIKGVHLKNSASPPELVKATRARMEALMQTVSESKPISITEYISSVIATEDMIRDSILNNEVKFFKKMKIKSKEAYANEAQSPYQYHVLWRDVFEPKYGPVAEPTYPVVKIPLRINNKTQFLQWLESIQDAALRERLLAFMNKTGKKMLKTLYISVDYVMAFGIPPEIKNFIDIKRIQLDLTNSDRIILESLGYFAKKKTLLRESYVIDEPELLAA